MLIRIMYAGKCHAPWIVREMEKKSIMIIVGKYRRRPPQGLTTNMTSLLQFVPPDNKPAMGLQSLHLKALFLTVKRISQAICELILSLNVH